MHGQLASNHDEIASLQSLGDDDVVTLFLPEGHLAKIGGVVLLNDIDKWSLLADLRGLIRNQHRTLGCGKDQPDVHELARPKMAIRIGDRGAEADGAAAVLNGIVKKREIAGAAAIFGVRGNAHQDLEAASIHLAADFGQVAFGDGEVGIDRIELLE